MCKKIFITLSLLIFSLFIASFDCTEHIEIEVDAIDEQFTYSIESTRIDYTSEILDNIPEPTYDISENDVIILAKLMYGECRGVEDDNKKAAVCWVVLNRLDNGGYGNSIEEVVTFKNQFTGYRKSNPVCESLYELAYDVLYNYMLEKDGFEGCYRVIPSDYLWFYGVNNENVFRNSYKGGTVWDWSYPKFY